MAAMNRFFRERLPRSHFEMASNDKGHRKKRALEHWIYVWINIILFFL